MKLIVFLFLLSTYAADPLPTARTPAGRGSWNGLVGVPDHMGGVNGSGPRRTTVYTNFSAGASYASIQAAVNSCPSNQVVLLAAGDYDMGGNRIEMSSAHGVTLRGAGLVWTNGEFRGLTRLNNTDTPSVQIGRWQWWEQEADGTPTAGKHTNWTSGYTQGATNITLEATGDYAAGKLIVLDQLNDNTDVPASAWGNASGGTYASGYYASVAFPTSGRDRYQYQVNRIYSVSGTNVTLYEPLYLPNWNAGGTNDPEAWRFTSGPILGVGVEDLETEEDTEIHLGYGCWISNTVAHAKTAHANGILRPYWSVRCTIEHNYADATNYGEDTYGIESRACSGLLVQNNITRKINTGLNPSGSVGSVWAYNVMTGQSNFFGVILQGLLQHGGNPNMNLYEGNYCPAIGIDNTWGSSSYNTALRNRAIGYNPLGGTNLGLQYAFTASATNRYTAAIGNVFGTAGVHGVYEEYVGDGDGCNDPAIYYFGYWDVGCNTSGASDAASRSTCIRAYNWTSATSTNNGIVLDGFTAGDIPNSYYLTSKPEWFGGLTYPPIDPATPTYSGSYTNIPAGYRDTFGADPPAESGGGSSSTASITTGVVIGTGVKFQ